MKKYEAPTLWTLKLLKEDVLAEASVTSMGDWVDGDGITIGVSGLF